MDMQRSKTGYRRERAPRAGPGTLTCETFRDAERSPQLDEFFDQHVRRWQSTGAEPLPR
jgi:hypothetical protein